MPTDQIRGCAAFDAWDEAVEDWGDAYNPGVNWGATVDRICQLIHVGAALAYILLASAHRCIEGAPRFPTS